MAVRLVVGIGLPVGLALLMAGTYLFAAVPEPRPAPAAEGDVTRGAYVARVAGCIACHTDTDGGGAFLAGGPPIVTAFGTFYAPNITPHRQDGIGGWTLSDFMAAMTAGKAPDGRHYFPVFPYTEYTRMTDQDIVDLWAAMQTVPAAPGRPPFHDIDLPFANRTLLAAWNTLFLKPGSYQPDPRRSDSWNRGAYIVTGPGHCGACHTPRNALGARIEDRSLAGTENGPDGDRVSPITGPALRAAGWTVPDIVFALRFGLTPDGDSLGGSMGHVISDSTSWLSDGDLAAVAEYLMASDEGSD